MIAITLLTRDRRPFFERALRYALAQRDCPPFRVVVLDDGHDAVEDLCGRDPRVAYYSYPPGTFPTLGDKRNESIALAHDCDTIAIWDDDDWSHSNRLEVAVGTLEREAADFAAAAAGYRLTLGTHKVLYQPGPSLDAIATWPSDPFGIIFASGVFKRSLWERVGGFPARDVGEDVKFCVRAKELGARFATWTTPMRSGWLLDALYLIVDHAENTSRRAPTRPFPWRLTTFMERLHLAAWVGDAAWLDYTNAPDGDAKTLAAIWRGYRADRPPRLTPPTI